MTFKYLLYSLLSLLLMAAESPITNNLDDCDGLVCEIKKSDTTDNLANGKVEVVVTKGNVKGLKFILCKENGDVLNEGLFQKNSFIDLPSGEYYCLVIDKKCHKKLKITIF